MTTVGLCMIVKNESSAILSCLRSVRPLVDYALIVDTGSTDGTQRIVREYLSKEGLTGNVIEEPWRDFAYNRSFALAKLRERTDIDYALVMDAGDTLVLSNGFDARKFKGALDKDSYDVEIRLGPTRYWRTQVLSNKLEFGYKGVLYEYVVRPPQAAPSEAATGLHIEAGRLGPRQRTPQEFRDRALTLEKALEAETDEFTRARYTFYLAESWMNAGEREKALQLLLRRAELGGWNTEICLGLCHAARLKEALGYPDTDVIGTYLKAYEADPTRGEPLHGAMQYCRRNNRYQQGYLIGKHAITMPKPSGSFIVEPWIYDYGLLEEFAVAAFRTGHYKDCLQTLEKILADGKIPASEHERLRNNIKAAEEKLEAERPKDYKAPSPRKAEAARRPARRRKR